jgi:beta-lactamase class D
LTATHATKLLALTLTLCPAHLCRSQDFQRVFSGSQGCFVLLDVARNKFIRSDAARCAERLSPWSTFKIPNSLISLELGIVPDTLQVTPWDGVVRDRTEWNRDQTLSSAFSLSAVWYYQRLARATGMKRMRDYLRKIHYGNEDISGGIDRFWLGSSLRISADEQVDFLRRLLAGQLPFSARSIQILQDIMVVARTPEEILRGKTGMGGPADSRLNWFVGYLERGPNVYIFATNVQGSDIADPQTARRITESILRELKLP